MEGPIKIIESDSRTAQKSQPVLQGAVQMFVELCRAWFWDHCHGEPVPMLSHLWVKNLFLTCSLNLP